jgi:hypothetical protein
MTMLEPQYAALWFSKQSVQGTAGAAGSARRQPWVSDDLAPTVDDGNLPVSDMTLYGANYQYRNTVSAGGSPQFAGLPSEVAFQLWLAHGGETVTAGTNEVQTLAVTGTPTGGSFTLNYTYKDATTGQLTTATSGTIAFNATAANVTTALSTITQLSGNFTAGGGPLPATPVTITYNTALAAQPVRALTLGTNSLTGGTTPTAAVTRTTPGVKRKHLFKSTLGVSPFWFTAYRRLGLGAIDRYRIADCLITGWTLAGGNGDQKIVRITPTILGLSPQGLTTDPTDAFPVEYPWLYTDAAGTWTIGGVVYSGQSQFNIAASNDRTPVYGDSVTPVDLASGNATLTVGTTMVANQQALDLRNLQFYGTTSPTTGQAPLSSIPSAVSYSGYLKQRESDNFLNGNDIKLTFPSIQLNVPAAPGPNTGGGATDLAFTGTLFPVSGQDPYTIEVWCDEPAFT